MQNELTKNGKRQNKSFILCQFSRSSAQQIWERKTGDPFVWMCVGRTGKLFSTEMSTADKLIIINIKSTHTHTCNTKRNKTKRKMSKEGLAFAVVLRPVLTAHAPINRWVLIFHMRKQHNSLWFSANTHRGDTKVWCVIISPHYWQMNNDFVWSTIITTEFRKIQDLL